MCFASGTYLYACSIINIECTLSEYEVEESKVLEQLDVVTITKREVELVRHLT